MSGIVISSPSVTDHTGRRRLDDERDYVRHEIRTALERNVRVLPVLVQGAAMVGPESLPSDVAALSEVQAFTLESRHYDRDIEQVYRSIDGIVGYGGEIPRFDRQRTAVAGFVGLAAKGPTDEPTLLTKWPQFEYTFGGFEPGLLLAHAVHGWFGNGGGECYVMRVGDGEGTARAYGLTAAGNTGFAALQGADGVTIVAAPDIVGLYRIRVEFGFALELPGEFTRMMVEQPSGNVSVYAD